VGRIAIEKNLAAFLRLDLPGTKVVVGDGPARASLEASFPDARFLGTQTGEDLADIYSSADVFVFPSLTDTFGLVLLEAMASGLPVAAFPVAGALDVVDQSGAGVLDMDLKLACLEALSIPRWKPRARSEAFSWDESASHFIANLLAANPA
jgi:glycosyltransferase involved in cell wall biosynthesis